MTSDEDAKKTTKDKAVKVERAAAGAASESTGDLDAAAGRVSDVADDLYGHAQSKAAAAAESMTGSASDALAAGQRAYQTGSEQVVRQVTKQPIEALFLAGAIGFLVGWAVNRT